MSVPEWVKSAVFYQIFPDRFFNGDSSNDPENVLPWGSKPTLWGFQGGDLIGIVQKLDYLLDLGINAIYLNPIFHSTSTHRYDTIDYFKIDPKLGDLNDFKKLLETAHSKGIKIILDGVFNHTGRGFFAFNDILDNGYHSPYKNWYHIHRFPVNAYGEGDAVDYYGWWNYKSLPKLKIDHKPVRDYLFSVAEYWISLGVDGWRLDVPNEIDDDLFWEEFRYRVKSINSDAFLVGEIWESNTRWVSDTHFDSLMNYPLREIIVLFLTHKISANQLNKKIDDLMMLYPLDNVQSMFNLLGSHDTKRIISLLHRDAALVKLAFLIIFSLPGAPVIYYGDEVGITGGKDPLCRKAFPWDEINRHKELRRFIQKLIIVRKENPELRLGEMIGLSTLGNKCVFSFARKLHEERMVTIINANSSEEEVDLSVEKLGFIAGDVLEDLISGLQYPISNDGKTLRIRIQPKTGLLLKWVNPMENQFSI